MDTDGSYKKAKKISFDKRHLYPPASSKTDTVVKTSISRQKARVCLRSEEITLLISTRTDVTNAPISTILLLSRIKPTSAAFSNPVPLSTPKGIQGKRRSGSSRAFQPKHKQELLQSHNSCCKRVAPALCPSEHHPLSFLCTVISRLLAKVTSKPINHACIPALSFHQWVHQLIGSRRISHNLHLA